MPEESDQEKTESATPRKRDKAREEGQVAQTRELPNAVVFGAALFVFSLLSTWIWAHALDVFRKPLLMIGQVDVTVASLRHIVGALVGDVAVLLGPLLIVIMAVGVGAHVAQIGFLVSSKALTPKLGRINPLSGFKRFVSLRGLVELVKNLAKIGLIGYIVWRTIEVESDQLLNLTNHDAQVVFAFALMLMFRIFVRVALILLVLAILDYAYQHYDHEKKLRMTKQEVKEEYKQTEGDPQIRARIRRIQREIAMRRMMQEVPKADVVITNPTHVAVAIKYDAAVDPAPRVVAKGRGYVASRIRQTAQMHGVPILERPELARILDRVVKLNQFVPPGLYQALAEVLAYVFNLRERRSV